VIQSVPLIPRRFIEAALTGKAEAILIQRFCCLAICRI
jgi:hypothetical protein